MARTLIVLFLGLSMGAAGAWWLGANRSPQPGISEPVVVRDIVDVPKMHAVDAEAHREDRYARIRTIEDTLALPGDFTQTEALYVLAGRADSAAVQELIHQANRIADPTDRNAALSILFLRLAELDPLSALTLARLPGFSKNRGLEATTWRTWSKLDLDAALQAAKNLRNPRDRNEAAQSMLAAYGYLGNAGTERIEKELGVRPNSESMARYLYNIADRSPAEAVSWIESRPPAEQQQLVRSLAGYLARRDSAQMLGYAHLFDNVRHRKVFEDTVSLRLAQEQPERFLENLPAGSVYGPRNGPYQVAMHALAAQDIERAIEFYEGLTSPQHRMAMGSVIAAELVKKDPDLALRWALEHDTPGSSVLVGVLSQLAAVEPARALRMIDQIDDKRVKSQLLSNVVLNAAQADTQAVRDYVDTIADPRDRRMAEQALVNAWLQFDPEAAVDYVLTADISQGKALVMHAGSNLAMHDLDAAIRTLARVDDQVAAQWRPAIAQQILQQRGIEAARRFLEQQRGQPGFAEMQAAVINGLVDQDIHAARQMVDSMPAGPARDQSFATVISRHAHRDPREAASWVASIEDESLRAMASQQVASAWHRADPQGAVNWVLNQPAGAVRDDAILGLSANLANQGEALTAALVEQIDDPQKRKQAYMLEVWNVARTDQERARAILRKLDLTDEERRQIETQISQSSRMYYEGFGVVH